MFVPKRRVIKFATETIVVILSVLILCIGGKAAPAQAHAYLERTTPSAQESVRQSPDEVKLQFSEQIQNESPFIAVAGSSGKQIQSGTAEINKQSANIVSVRLNKHLPKDLYTVSWRVISADGHPVSGTFVFGVGKAAQGFQSAAQSESAYTPSWPMLLDRFLLYGSMAFFIGIILLLAYLLPKRDELAEHGRRVFRTGHLASAWVIFAALLLNLPLQVTVLRNVPWSRALDPVLLGDVLTHSTAGALWIWQMPIVSLLIVSVWLVYRARLERNPAWWTVPLVLFAVLAGTKALSGHAFGYTERVIAVVADMLHMLSASLWVGGLLAISLLRAVSMKQQGKDGRKQMLRTVVSRFALPAAMGLVGVLAGGVLLSVMYVPSFSALTTTLYGKILLVKLACFIVMGLLGLTHYLTIRQKKGQLPLKSTFIPELLLGLSVFVIAAVLTNVQTPPPPPPIPFFSEEAVQGGKIGLAVSPAVSGENDFTVTLKDAQGQPYTHAQQVDMIVNKQFESGSPSQLIFKKTGSGIYEAKGLYISSTGNWELTVHILTDSFQDIEKNFYLRVIR